MPPFGNLYGMAVFAEESLAKDKEITFNMPICPIFGQYRPKYRAFSAWFSLLTVAVPPAALTTRTDATAAMKLFVRSAKANTPAR